MSFSLLPVEVLVEIFSQLGVTVLTKLALVCKKFYSAANQPFLWKRLCERDIILESPQHFGKNQVNLINVREP